MKILPSSLSQTSLHQRVLTLSCSTSNAATDLHSSQTPPFLPSQAPSTTLMMKRLSQDILWLKHPDIYHQAPPQSPSTTSSTLHPLQPSSPLLPLMTLSFGVQIRLAVDGPIFPAPPFTLHSLMLLPHPFKRMPCPSHSSLAHTTQKVKLQHFPLEPSQFHPLTPPLLQNLSLQPPTFKVPCSLLLELHLVSLHSPSFSALNLSINTLCCMHRLEVSCSLHLL